MDYVSLNVVWAIANAVLAVLYKTVLSEILGNRELLKLGNSSIPFLQKIDKMDARQIIAIAIFIIFTAVTIKKYNRDREKDVVGLIITMILGVLQLWVMCKVVF